MTKMSGKFLLKRLFIWLANIIYIALNIWALVFCILLTLLGIMFMMHAGELSSAVSSTLGSNFVNTSQLVKVYKVGGNITTVSAGLASLFLVFNLKIPVKSKSYK